MPADTLRALNEELLKVPEGFTVHPKLLKQFEARDKLWAGGEVDWALAEAMAYGSLLLEGGPTTNAAFLAAGIGAFVMGLNTTLAAAFPPAEGEANFWDFTTNYGIGDGVGPR